MPIPAFSQGLGPARRKTIPGIEKMVLPRTAYYVLTKSEESLPNWKEHPNTGSPNFNIKHDEVTGVVLIEMVGGEPLVDGNVVAVAASGKIIKTSSPTQNVLGVVHGTIATDATGKVAVVGKKTVICIGTVAIGRLLVGASGGRVAQFTSTTSKSISAHGSHTHPISDAGITGASSTAGGASANHTDIPFTSGEFAGGFIVGRALTSGTNEEIDILVSLMG